MADPMSTPFAKANEDKLLGEHCNGTSTWFPDLDSQTIESHATRLSTIEGRLNLIDRRVGEAIALRREAARLESSTESLRSLIAERCAAADSAVERLAMRVEAQAALLEEVHRCARAARLDSEQRTQDIEAELSRCRQALDEHLEECVNSLQVIMSRAKTAVATEHVVRMASSPLPSSMRKARTSPQQWPAQQTRMLVSDNSLECDTGSLPSTHGSSTWLASGASVVTTAAGQDQCADVPGGVRSMPASGVLDSERRRSPSDSPRPTQLRTLTSRVPDVCGKLDQHAVVAGVRPSTASPARRNLPVGPPTRQFVASAIGSGRSSARSAAHGNGSIANNGYSKPFVWQQMSPR